MKVTLLTVPRTAGTYYGNLLAEKYNLPYLGEKFNQDSDQRTILNQALNMEVGVCKVHADMDAFILNTLLAKSDKTYFLIRKDIDAQVKSILCARHLNPSNPWDPRSYDRTIDSGETIDIHIKESEVETYKEKFTFMNNVIINYSKVFKAELKYTEDIVEDDYNPYKQKYNLIIGK